jgi:hypothetical protein
MNLNGITYRGSELDPQSDILNKLPDDLTGVLKQINGFIQFGGALHVRGVCETPAWHSIAEVMFGPDALYRSYDAIEATDVPFAQDCVADQFLLRGGIVHKLASETGTVDCLSLSLRQFFLEVEANPVEFLQMHPLMRFRKDGGALQPGQVLGVWPPFCTKEAANGVSLRAIGAAGALAFLADFSRQVGNVADGQVIRIQLT